MMIYIALLRGINVSGQKKVPMLELRELFNTLGFKRVQTYIQSGNVVFDTSENDKAILEAKIFKGIEKQFGFEVPVLIKTRTELNEIVLGCPFAEAKKEKSYFTLLHTRAEKEWIDSINETDFKEEEILATQNCVYFFSEKGYGNAKCNNNFIERKLKVSATTRNYKTIINLLDRSSN